MLDADKIDRTFAEVFEVTRKHGEDIAVLKNEVATLKTIPGKLDELNTTTIRMAASLESIEKWNKKLWGIVIVVALCGGGGTAAVLGYIKNGQEAQPAPQAPAR